MKSRVVNSQLNNYKTYLAYKLKMMTLAENVFQFKNMNPFIDLAFINSELVTKGSIAFFKDEVMGLIALPYTSVGSLDIYGRPTKIAVIPKNGVYNRILRSDEFVIMYDNDSHLPIYPNIVQSAERLALIKRTIDINIKQQRTPRYFKTSEENQKTVQNLLNNVDSEVDTVFTYDNVDLEETTGTLVPAPYVADKLNQEKHEEWAEFLELIGITNVSVQKRERVIRDEIICSMGGTIASRYSRFSSRKRAIDEINEKFKENIEVEFYDGLPTTIENVDEFLNNSNIESEVDENVSNDVSYE
jgi:hypothetical protein